MVKELKESDLCKSFIRQVKTRQCYKYYSTPFEILHIANEHKAFGCYGVITWGCGLFCIV
jgi:hypothetical protein